MSNAAASSPPPPLSPRARLITCRPLDDGDLALARALVTEHGLTDAARALDLPRATLAQAAAGSRLREGTRMVVADRLRRRASGR